MNLNSLSFSDGEPMPEKYASKKNDGPHATQPAENVNPSFSWTEIPEGTKSFALLCCDPDVPADKSQANREGAVIAEDAPRSATYHWVVVDLPAEQYDLDEGSYSLDPSPPEGVPWHSLTTGRCGINDIRKRAAAGDPNAGNPRYDGPAPPWNDLRVHRYEFTLYALSIPSLDLAFPFYAADALAAIQGHVIESATLCGMYTLNPELAPTQVGPTSAT